MAGALCGRDAILDGAVIGDRDTLSFEVSPSGTVAQLLSSTDVEFDAQAVYNTVVKSSVEMVELPVVEKFGSGDILTVVVSGENMRGSFFSGDEGASCRVRIKTGDVEKISGYVQMALLTMTTISGFSQTMTVNVIPMDLSSNGTANCYIVHLTGHFSFKATVKGNNSSCPLDGTPTRAKVLWESYGTDMRPKVGSLISQVLFRTGKLCSRPPKC